MRNSLQTAFAVVAGVLLVATAALGGTMMQPGVDDLDDAAGQHVERADGQVALGAGLAVGIAAGVGANYVYDNYIKNSPNTDDLAKTDALETKKEIYDQASIQKQNNELTSTAYANYLNDTESIALMEGKNAYIRALENGSAEPVARSEATEAVSGYYATKQMNLRAAWNTTLTVAHSARETARNTSGVSGSFVNANWNGASGRVQHFTRFNGSQAVTLVNSSSVDVASIHMREDYQGDIYNDHTTPADNPEDNDLSRIAVEPPNSNFDQLKLLEISRFTSLWSEIQSQNTEVQNQLDTFINNTYSSYQQGEINSSDLVDPYIGARDYDPETSDTWTLRTLSAMGMDTPQNLSNVGRMNVTADGQQYTGVLMSDGTPTDGYAVGGTYNAENITGAQFVATDDGDAVELEGTFSLDSVTTADGETLAENETVEYKEVNYETANTSEFKALQEDLDNLTAEVNARQQRQRNAGGGGMLPDFGQGGAIPGALLLAGAAAFLLTRD